MYLLKMSQLKCKMPAQKYIHIQCEMSAAEVVAQLAGLEIDSDSCKNMNEYKKNHNFFN